VNYNATAKCPVCIGKYSSPLSKIIRFIMTSQGLLFLYSDILQTAVAKTHSHHEEIVITNWFTNVLGTEF